MKKKNIKLIVGFIAIFVLTSCVQVKGYQKIYLNDEDMVLSLRKLEGYESAVHAYREGASGAESGKVGGGCGCN